MLVLSRKPNQQIVVNGNIVITILRVRGNSVRIGIEAPGEVGIRRAELDLLNVPGAPTTAARQS
jgi:carbon storage regulator CsrA